MWIYEEKSWIKNCIIQSIERKLPLQTRLVSNRFENVQESFCREFRAKASLC